LTLILLLATFSRGGLLTVAVAAVLTLLLVGRAQIRAAASWLFSDYRNGRRLVLKVGSLTLIVLAAAGALLFLGQKGYIARLWSTQSSSLQEFLIANSAGARAAYAWSALATYGEHPWLGVGPGASGLYMYSHLPDWALTTVPEIARQLSPDSALYPNPKNLFVRLLAETGLIGFFLFLAFQAFLLGDALAAWRQPNAVWRCLGVAGIFTGFALVVYNMTQDSLAIPNLWINLGVLAGLSAASFEARHGGPEPGQG
jgi:O-antigen ligase